MGTGVAVGVRIPMFLHGMRAGHPAGRQRISRRSRMVQMAHERTVFVF